MIRACLFVTDFADAGALVPLVAAVALALLVLRQPGLALRWSLVNLAAWGAIVALKLAGYTLAGTAASTLLATTPSGHVAGAAAACAGLAALAGLKRALVLALAAGTAGLIGATRLVLAQHTPAEVAVGAAVGLGAALLATRLLRPAPRRPALAAFAAVVLLGVHGTHATWEPFIAQTSDELRAALR